MSKRTCKVDGCLGEVQARMMCRSHYQHWYRYGDPVEKPIYSRACAHCEKRFKTEVSHQKYCSSKCGVQFSVLRRKELERAERLSTVLECRQCGAGFFPVKSLGKLYCSDFCSRKWRRENAPGECEVAECVSVVKARGMCAKHYSAWRRAEGLDTWKEAWTPARKAAYQARRARKRGVDAERVVAVDVFDRDGWLCGICGGEVDSGLEWPDSGSASLDHIIPLSKGGTHTYANTQLAHLFCNVSKGNSLPIGREALSA